MLTALAGSGAAPYRSVVRAKALLDYAAGERVSAIARRLEKQRRVVDRWIERASQIGPAAALQDLPRSGRPPAIPDDAKAWVGILVVPEAEGSRLLLRDALLVYKDVSLIREEGGETDGDAVAVSYDEKPGIQAIENTAPDLAPVPGKRATIARDHEYKRHGTVTLMAAINLLAGVVVGMVVERQRSKEFIEFLKLLLVSHPQPGPAPRTCTPRLGAAVLHLCLPIRWVQIPHP